MSSGGYAASSSGCATRPKAREIGSTECAGPTQHSLPIGYYVTATAEHREPCDSRGSCTVLGAPGGGIPPGDSTTAAGFISVTAEKVSKRAYSGSAREAAIANCHGGLLRAQIEKFAPDRLNEITDAVAAAIAARFGDGPIDAPIHAILFTGVRPASK